MKIYFSKCISELMSIAGIKNSSLAKSINVDASLINKWKKDKAIPPLNSGYIDLISGYVVKSMANTEQLHEMADFIKRNLPSSEEIHEMNLQDPVRKLLLESQGYSINKRRMQKAKSGEYAEQVKAGPLSDTEYQMNQSSKMISKTISSNVQIINGYENILNAAVELLEAAGSVNPPYDDSILITLNGAINWLPYYLYSRIKRKDLLNNLMKKGWDITYLLNINTDHARNQKILAGILDLGLYSNAHLYYSYCVEYRPSTEIIIVPNIGALFCLQASDRFQIDSALLIKDCNIQKFMEGYFKQSLASAKPLLNPNSPLTAADFVREYTETESHEGKRYCYNSGLISLTLPSNLYKKYIKQSSNISKEEQLTKLKYHEYRLEAFESQIMHYKFRDMITFESIDNMVTKGEYSFLDKYFFSRAVIASKEDIIRHLSNTIRLLKKYENYEIGLIHEKKMQSFITTWILKQNASVSLFTYPSDKTDTLNNIKAIKAAKGFTITEPNIAKAFEEYYNIIWNNLNPENKNKSDVIKFLESKIELISSDFHAVSYISK